MKYLIHKNNVVGLGLLTIAALRHCTEEDRNTEALVLSVVESTKANWDLLTESDRETIKQYIAKKTLELSVRQNNCGRDYFLVTIDPSAHWVSKFYQWIQKQEEDISSKSVKELINKELGDEWEQTAPSQVIKISTTWGDNNNEALNYLAKVSGAIALWSKCADGYVVISSKLPGIYIGQVVE